MGSCGTTQLYDISAQSKSFRMRLVELSRELQPPVPVRTGGLSRSTGLRREMRQVNDIYWDTLSLVYLYYSWFPELVTMSNPEEWGYIPFGHLQPTGDGANACLYCSHYESHPTLVCVPITVCHLHQGLIQRERVSSVVCRDWSPRKNK